MGNMPQSVKTAYEDDPALGLSLYTSFVKPYVASNQDAFERWVAQQLPDLQGRYHQTLAENPNLSWLEFLGSVDPVRQWNMLAPSQRGERPSDFWVKSRWIR